MRRRTACLLVGIAVCILTCGCFDLETEVHFLEDGSGFVTQWVRMDVADVTAAAALNRSSVAAWSEEVLAGLTESFSETQGVGLLDRKVSEQAGRVVLFYRFFFDNVQALNTFMSDPVLDDQYVLPAKGNFSFRASPAACGGQYESTFTFSPRDQQNLTHFGQAEIDALSPEDKEKVVSKFFSGQRMLRVVLPGKTEVHDAGMSDGKGRPIYQSTVLDFYRKGVAGKVRSKVVCDDPNKAKAEKTEDKPTGPITLGYVPTAQDVLQTAKGLAHFLDILYEFDCDTKGRVKISATFLVSGPLAGPFEFYFPLLFLSFPKMETDYDLTLEKAGENLYRYRFVMKKPVRFGKLGSHYVYYGKQKGYYSFRANLPKMEFAGKPPVAEAAASLMRVKVTLPAKIRLSNATEVGEKTAIWTLTDRMFRENKILLEALSE